MGLSGPQGYRLMAVSPARTDPIAAAERRAHRRIGRYDWSHRPGTCARSGSRCRRPLVKCVIAGRGRQNRHHGMTKNPGDTR